MEIRFRAKGHISISQCFIMLNELGHSIRLAYIIMIILTFCLHDISSFASWHIQYSFCKHTYRQTSVWEIQRVACFIVIDRKPTFSISVLLKYSHCELIGCKVYNEDWLVGPQLFEKQKQFWQRHIHYLDSHCFCPSRVNIQNSGFQLSLGRHDSQWW